MLGVHRHRVKGERKRLSPRRALQLGACALFNGYALGFAKGKIFTGPTKGICVPVLNCYSCPGALGACPIGALQTAIGGQRGHFPFYVLGMLVLFGVLLGRGVCGLLCPFGLVQDLLHKIPSPKATVPRRLDKPARSLKYVVLAVLVMALPALASGAAPVPYFCKYLCPAGTLEGGIPLLLSNPSLRQAAGWLFVGKLLVLALVLALCVPVYRPFCKYLCPLGAFYALFNRFSLYRLHLDKGKCTGCSQCREACPMGVEVLKDVNSAECIRCGKCRSVCPSGAISHSLGAEGPPAGKKAGHAPRAQGKGE
ncbi:4Fe-4S binding protein [bacterium D16-76]|nr:4Fe-4S binding protein [bacterium D16-76]